jgi:hypothetical protein
MSLEQFWVNKFTLRNKCSGDLIEIIKMLIHHFHELTTFQVFTLKGQCRG